VSWPLYSTQAAFIAFAHGIKENIGSATAYKINPQIPSQPTI